MSNAQSETKVTRRSFLRTQAALAAAAAAAPVPALAAGASSAKPAAAVDYYEKLGVQTFINAAGTYTNLSSACMPEQVQEATACAQREVTRYGGSLQSVVMDDKGITLFAAFGLPGHSHEDDCVRAVRAVLTLESWLKERGIACSVGITRCEPSRRAQGRCVARS